MTKNKKLAVLLTSLLLVSCSNLTPDQIGSIGDILKTSASPSIKLSPSPSASSQKITLDGTVYDSSKVRVDGVTVKINGQTTVTDSTGHYFFSDLLLGNTSITLSRDGFNDYVEQQELKEKAQTINFTVSFTSKPQIATNGQAFLPTITPSTTNLKTSFDGYLRQEGTDKPLANTALKIGTASAITDSRGYFIFHDIPVNSTILLEYLNGLDKEPSQQPILLVSGVNSLILYYHTNQPQPTPTPIVTPYPTPIPTPTIFYTPYPTPTPNISILPILDPNTPPPKSVFKNREGLTGVWEFTFTARQGTSSYKSIFAFMPHPESSAAFLAEEILDTDKSEAINGRIKSSYFNYTFNNSFLFKGLWDSFSDNHFFITYKYYDNLVLQTGLYLSLIEPLIPIDKDTLLGIDARITNGKSSSYNIVGKRIRDNFSLLNYDGTIFKTYTAKYN